MKLIVVVPVAHGASGPTNDLVANDPLSVQLVSLRVNHAGI